MTRRRGSVGLGRTQKLVLRLLATNGACSARELSYHWPTLTESAAYAAVMRLADRSLVDAAGWNYSNERTYALTDKGRTVEASLNTVCECMTEEDEDGVERVLMHSLDCPEHPEYDG